MFYDLKNEYSWCFCFSII